MAAQRVAWPGGAWLPQPLLKGRFLLSNQDQIAPTWWRLGRRGFLGEQLVPAVVIEEASGGLGLGGWWFFPLKTIFELLNEL